LFNSSPPQILSASVYPEKIMPGQVMIVTVQAKDTLGIKSAIAIFGNEKMADERSMPLITGNGRDGVYETRWIAHDTLAQKWYNTTIIFTDILGKKTKQEIAWQDPTVSHKASDITAGTFGAGDYVFPNNLTINGRLSSLDNDMVINNVISMYTALNLSNAGYTKLGNGMVDAFKGETGVDTAASVTESYDATNDLYSPSLGSEVVDQSQTATDSANALGDYADMEYREANSFKLSGLLLVTAVEVRRSADTGGTPTGDWTLRIETDASGLPSGTLVNANAFIVVTPPAENNVVKGTFATPFSLSGATSYWLVMQCVNQANGDRWSISQGENTAYTDGIAAVSYDGGASWATPYPRDMYFKIYTKLYANISLVSNTMKAQSAPANTRVTLFEEDVSAVNLNTDLKTFVSRDNGTTWTQATLASKGNYTGNIQILSGIADISSQPSNTLMKWNVTSYNSKNLKIRGVGLNWE
jgi:hypothetical protein